MDKLERRTLPSGLMIKKAWWVGLRKGKQPMTAFLEGDFEIGEELECKDLNLLNYGLQNGEEFLSLSKELCPGLHVIGQIFKDKKIYPFLIDVGFPGIEHYPGDVTIKWEFKPGAKKDPNFLNELKKMLGFEPDELP